MSLRTLIIAMLGGVPAERFRKAEEETETWFSRWDEESKAHNLLLRKLNGQEEGRAETDKHAVQRIEHTATNPYGRDVGILEAAAHLMAIHKHHPHMQHDAAAANIMALTDLPFTAGLGPERLEADIQHLRTVLAATPPVVPMTVTEAIKKMFLDEKKPEFDEFDKGWNAAIRAMSALDTRVDNPNSHTTTEVLRHG